MLAPIGVDDWRKKIQKKEKEIEAIKYLRCTALQYDTTILYCSPVQKKKKKDKKTRSDAYILTEQPQGSPQKERERNKNIGTLASFQANLCLIRLGAPYLRVRFLPAAAY